MHTTASCSHMRTDEIIAKFQGRRLGENRQEGGDGQGNNHRQESGKKKRERKGTQGHTHTQGRYAALHSTSTSISISSVGRRAADSNVLEWKGKSPMSYLLCCDHPANSTIVPSRPWAPPRVCYRFLTSTVARPGPSRP